MREKNERFKLSSLLRTRGSVYCREDSGQEEREVLQSKLVEMYLGKNKVREKNRGSSSQVYKEREVQYTVERTVTKKNGRSFKVNGQ